eukprot:scaffold14_cov302-Chaetoceros_neogracile.AAC.5
MAANGPLGSASTSSDTYTSSHDCTANARLYYCMLSSSVQWRHMTARSILKKMEATRDAALKGAAALAWPENFPVANSYSSVIIGILHSTIDAEMTKLSTK